MSTKLTKTLSAQVLILLVLAMVNTACSAPPPPPTNPPPNPPTNAPPPGKADLILGVTYIESYNDSYNTYQIVSTIENLGNADATTFNAGCTYQCPAGDTYISGGLEIVQAGYIAANSSFTYKTPFHYMCTVSTPKVDLMCTIESPDGGTQTYSVAQVSLP